MNSPYPTAKYLVYVETTTNTTFSESKLTSSCLVDHAMTKEDAKEKVKKYENIYRSVPNTEHRVVFIENKSEWWTSSGKRNPVNKDIEY